MMQAFRTVLPGGVRVVSAPMPGIEGVAMSVWAGVGGRHEPARLCGISHFVEHLLFKGTARLSAREISEAIEGRGGYLNAFTQEEETCYYARVPAEHAREAFGILADMYLNSRFDARDIETERGVILDEIQSYRDQPQHVVEDLLGDLVWPGHALGRPLVGRAETVRRLTRGDLRAFKAARYGAQATVFAFSGPVPHAEWVDWTARAVGKRLGPGRVPCRPVTARVGQVHAGGRVRDTEQLHVALGFRVFGRHDRRRHALRILNVILGENMSSRLFQHLRERHGLAYSINSSLTQYTDSGILAVSADLDPAKSGRAFRVLAHELRRIRARAPSARELERARDYVTGQLRLGLESSSRRMMWCGESELGYGRLVDPAEEVAALQAVGPEDVLRVARLCLCPAHASLAAVGPGMDGPGVAGLRQWIESI